MQNVNSFAAPLFSLYLPLLSVMTSNLQKFNIYERDNLVHKNIWIKIRLFLPTFFMLHNNLMK